MVSCNLVQALTSDEIEAAKAYASDATFFHAIYQGRQEELAELPAFQKFRKTAKAHKEGFDRAIGKCTLKSGVTLYSGHGRGFAIRGSMCGDSSKFLGLSYRYPGYISTSSAKAIAIGSFLVKRTFRGSQPTLLELRLPETFNALDMNMVGTQGEFEFLIGREREFVVIDASYFAVNEVEDPVLRLVLGPATVS